MGDCLWGSGGCSLNDEVNLCMKQKDEFRCSMVHNNGKPICNFEYSCVNQCVLCNKCIDGFIDAQGEMEETTDLAAVQKVRI